MLSIIIPVHNTSPYLSGCLDSLLCHTKCPYELILVDDGSTDNSPQICDDYATRYPNISVIHQPNQGVSAARNAGIEKAHGDWLWFVDGDDYIEDDVTIPIDISDRPMIVMGCQWEENNTITPMPASATDVPYNTWRCIFRRDMVENHNIRFTVGRRYAEDQEFILRYMLDTGCYGNVGVIGRKVYHYTVRPGSAVTSAGRKFTMLGDIFSVWCVTFFGSLRRGLLFKGWVMHELKRLAKTLLVTIFR